MAVKSFITLASGQKIVAAKILKKKKYFVFCFCLPSSLIAP